MTKQTQHAKFENLIIKGKIGLNLVKTRIEERIEFDRKANRFNKSCNRS
jgi:hypothetical protein